MSKMTFEEARALGKEITKRPKDEEKLIHKCRWEQMSRPAVLMEYGDPKDWD